MILHHIIEKGLLVLKEDIVGALTGDGDFPAKYRTICNAVRRYHRDCPQSVEHVNRAGTESFEQTELPDAVKRILVLGTEINGLLTALLEEGQAEGAVRRDIVPGMSVYVLYSGMTALLALAESKGEFIEKQFSLSEEEFLEYGFRQIISSMLVEKIDIRD